MSVVVDKIYRELSAKIEPINKARLEAVDIDKLLKKDKVAPILLAIDALEQERADIIMEINRLHREARVQMGIEHYMTPPSYKSYVKQLRDKNVDLIYIDKSDIEANVILSDVTDLDTLIENITRNITKDIPELN